MKKYLMIVMFLFFWVLSRAFVVRILSLAFVEITGIVGSLSEIISLPLFSSRKCQIYVLST
jgi:hypothetical protein